MDKKIDFKIIREIAVLSSKYNGWQLELSEVSWNGGNPKLEVRHWGPNHERCNKETTLTQEEAKALLAALQKELCE